MTEIDHIEIVPDSFGWSVRIYTDGINFQRYDIGDAIQFAGETERTIGRWLADGPADFHGCDPTEPMSVRDAEGYEYDETRPTCQTCGQPWPNQQKGSTSYGR